jgi:hypothetical protein
VWWMGSYSMILSKAAFIHHKYFELYTHQMPASIHQYVREARNCEDIAMSFLVANATSAPPLWVKGNLLLCSYLQFTFHFGICCFAPIFSVLSILAFVKLLVLWL